MKLTLENGEIALPRDYRFEITANHPFFSDDGSASTPASIPSTPQNRQLLDSPENYNRAHCYHRRFPAVLSHGVFSKRCRMVVESASRKGGISASLALEESELYAEIKDKQLKTLFSPGWVPFSGGIQAGMDSFYTNPNYNSAGLVFFPVAVDAKDAQSADSTGSKRIPSLVLNKVSSGHVRLSGLSIDRGDKGTVTAPSYYGVAPFMRLHAMLSRMFGACGYTVEENVFHDDPFLYSVVVLHNTADAMVGCIQQGHYNNSTGVGEFLIHFEDLVPSMTVGDVISWIRDKFGAFVTVKAETVRIRTLEGVLLDDPEDLSSYLREDPVVVHPDPRMLRLGCQHDIESADPAADTLEDLRSSFPQLIECDSVADAQGTGLFHVTPLGKFYFRNVANGQLSLVGTDGFDYWREMGFAAEEVTSDDSFVPMVYHDGEYMPYLGETVRRHIDIDDKSPDAEQKLQVCYVYTDGNRNWGTLYPRKWDGSDAVLYDLPPLTPEGMMAQWFHSYRDMLLSAAPTLQVKLDIPLHVLATMDLWTPKTVAGALVLIRSLKYNLSNAGASVCEATLQQLQEYVDTPEPQDPQFGSNLVWELVNTRTVFNEGDHKNGIEVVSTDGLTDYTSSDAPNYTPSKPGIIEKRRSRSLVYDRFEHSSGFLWSSQSKYRRTHTYEEYFISKNRQTP